MRRRLLLAPLLVAAGVLAGRAAAADSIALLPVRQGVRVEGLGAQLEQLAAAELARRATVIDAERVRAALRADRLRNADAAPPERLRAIAAALGADWLVSAAIHDAPEQLVPDLTVSARLYDGRTGRMAWAGAVARSGLDRRGLLGIGAVTDLETLLPPVVAELVADVELDAAAAAGPGAGVDAATGLVGIVPFTVNEVPDGIEVAAAATETMRALLVAAGVPLAEPGCVTQALRGPGGIQWGELSAEVRAELRDACGAARLVTGSVERWEVRGGSSPEPVVAVAVRLLDAGSGRILFVGSLEAGGWDREGWFGRGRVHSRGAHLRQLLERIATRMLRADTGGETTEVMKESG
jgi:hypothetical protein